MKNVQYEEVFWEYAERSEYKSEIIKLKENITEEKEKAADEGIAILINRAENICRDEVTFRKLSERGVKIRL